MNTGRVNNFTYTTGRGRVTYMTGRVGPCGHDPAPVVAWTPWDALESLMKPRRNFTATLQVKEFWKSVSIWRSYEQQYRPESRRRQVDLVDLAAPSQVKSFQISSRRRNFPLKSPPNFSIKVTTSSQNAVWTYNRQHASRSYTHS